MATGKELVTVEYDKEEHLTYGQVHEMSDAIARGLLMFDPSLKAGSRVGIYANTCKEWVIAFHAITGISMTVTTVYATLGWENLVICMNEAELSMIVCEAGNVENIDKYLGGGKCPYLKRLVVIGDVVEYKSKEFEMKTVYDLLLDGSSEKGKNLESIPPKPKAEDLALIMYTSGTTGTPKGVMIEHRNIVAAIAAYTIRLDYKNNKDDVHLSYLPLAHIFEVGMYCSLLFNNQQICFGNPRTLSAKPGGAKYIGDLAYFKPTLLAGVPKVWETIKKGVVAKVKGAGGMKEKLFNWVLGRKIGYLKEGKNVNVMLEGLVFGKVRQMLGGRMRYVCSGGAPLHEDTQYFLQACLGSKCTMIQGYGLTETIAGGCIQPLNPKVFTVGNVGFAVECSELKILSVPEMNYTVEGENCEGEILIRGPNVARGYFKRPDITKKAYDEDGWFHTGDIGRLNKDRTVTIIDRIKNLVKLSNGEYIAVENIEVKYGSCDFVFPNGIFVHCDPQEDHIVSVVVPDPAQCIIFSRNNHLGLDKVDEIIKHPEYLEGLEMDLKRIAMEQEMTHREALDLKRFVVRNDLWTPQNGLLTAALKLKRRSLVEKYREEIDSMYGRKEEEEEEGEGED